MSHFSDLRDTNISINNRVSIAYHSTITKRDGTFQSIDLSISYTETYGTEQCYRVNKTVFGLT